MNPKLQMTVRFVAFIPFIVMLVYQHLLELLPHHFYA